MAGLLSENSRNAVNKYPLIGDIPVLGNLFKSAEYQKDQTELVILITAHLAKPLDKRNIMVPTDTGYQPDDMEFFLNYIRDDAPRPANNPVGRGGGAALDGDFGHVVPVAVTSRQGYKVE